LVRSLLALPRVEWSKILSSALQEDLKHIMMMLIAIMIDNCKLKDPFDDKATKPTLSKE
jgi:hypothetical protein